MNGSFNFTQPTSANSHHHHTASGGIKSEETINGLPIGLKDLNYAHLTQLSVPQLAHLQQQLNLNMSQLTLQQQQQQQFNLQQQQQLNEAHLANVAANGRHQRGGSNSVMQNLQSFQQQAQPFYQQLSPTNQLFSQLHGQLSPQHQFQQNLLQPPVHPYAFTANQLQASNPSFPTSASSSLTSSANSSPASHTRSVPATRRNTRTTTAARLSPTPFPTVNLKLKRKLRKNNREKQRRSEINEQFEVLCHMLGLGAPPAGTSASTAALPKVEKFTILSEACHTITQLRLELAVYKSEKSENRLELEKLIEHMDGFLKHQGINMRGEELVKRFFPNLQRPDYVLPPSKAAQPTSSALDSDDDVIEEETEGDKEMNASVAESAVTSNSVSSEKPTRGGRVQHASSSSGSTNASNPYILASPPPLPSPTNPFGFDSNMNITVTGAQPFQVTRSGSPSLSTLLHTANANAAAAASGHHRVNSRGAAVDPSVPTHRPRQHSRSNSSSAIPRFGSNDFSSLSPSLVSAAKTAATHSRQASHARSRSLQMAINGLKEEEDLNPDGTNIIIDKPTLETHGGRHSRTNSNSIPPPQPIPGIGRLHTSGNSMDLGFGGGMLSSPSSASQSATFSGWTSSATSSKQPMFNLRPSHGRHPSGSSSSALYGGMHDPAHAGQVNGNSIPHHRQRSSMGGSDLFPPVSMDEDMNVFDSSYQ